MRRSAAPSQLQGKPFKKPKFIPPTRSNPSPNEENTKLDPDIQLSEVAVNNTFLQSQADPKIYSLNPLPAGDSGREMDHGKTSALPAFNLHHTVYSPPEDIPVSTEQEVEPGSVVRYFTVVWCKASKKKHRKWEGDAVLIVNGKSLTLKDLEGKDIGRGTGYKFKELEKIEEGHTMMIGGKEIEVMGTISPDDFSSGRCFQPGGGSPALSSSSQAAKKCFSNPLKSVYKPSSKENRQNSFQNCKPRHDPCAPSKI